MTEDQVAASPKAQVHAQLSAAVEAAVAGAHPHEAHKVERIRAAAANLHGFIDEIHGAPNLHRVVSWPNGVGNEPHTEAVHVVNDDGLVGEQYDPAVHGGNA